MSQPTGRREIILVWIARITAAAIMGQTLFFKFTGAPEARALFEQLGAEPWGRLGTGALELTAVALLLWPGRAALGGLLTVGIMSGAILSHLTVLGIAVADDGGALFGMGVVAWIAGAAISWRRRTELPVVGSRFALASSR